MTARTTRPASTLCLVLAALAVAAAGAGSAHAATWINAAGGAWQTGSNWQSGVVPASGDSATFNLAAAYTVTLTAPTAITGITNASDALTLNLGGTTLTNNDTLTVAGPSAGHTPTTTLLNGAFNASGVVTGGTAGAGTLVVGGGATLRDASGNALLIGFNGPAGTGGLTVTGGGAVRGLGGLYVGYYGGGGNATFSGVGSGYTAIGNGRLLVGDLVHNGAASSGTLTVANGATIDTTYTNTEADIGAAGATGALSVRDAGSAWTHSGNVYVGGTSLDTAGEAGTGTLGVADGAAVRVSESLTVRPGGTLRVAGGTVTVGGTATLSGTTQMQLVSLDANGTKVIAGTDVLNTTLAVSLAPGVTPAAGNRFDLFDGLISGTYAFDFSDAPLPGGLTWDTSGFAADGSIGVQAAPEPGTVTLAGASVCPLLLARRRRARQAPSTKPVKAA